jgi:hypothetical protein
MLLRWDNNVTEELQALMGRYAALPRHIAKKHLQAAMKRTVKDGVPILRSITPPLGVRRGRRRKGAFVPQNKSTGELRRAVTTKSKYIGRNADGVVYGVVGYKAGFNSRKAIWLEYGTRRGIRPQEMINRFMQQYGGPSLATLKSEMLIALDKAAKEVAGGKNPGKAF